MLVALLGSCASGVGQVPPGGPPDSTAPSIISTIPPNGSVNFRGETVEVEFSEYIQESALPAATIITPIPAVPPDYSWSGRTLSIEFDAPLVSDRTYAISFGSAISDLSGNRLGNPLTLRFSTGPRIDSGMIRGDVLGIGKRRVFVYAYMMPSTSPTFGDTLQPDQTRPDFIAPVADNGAFSLEGLPPGRFRLFAIADEYNDQLFTPGSDAYGTAPSDITLAEDDRAVSGVIIRLQPAPTDVAPPTLYAASSITSTRSEIRFSEPIDTATLRTANFTLSTATGPVRITDVWRSAVSRLAVQIAHDPLPAEATATVAVTALRDTSGNVIADSSGRGAFTVTGTRDSLPPALLPLAVDSMHAYTFTDSLLISFDERVTLGSPEGAVSIRDTARGVARFRVRRLTPVTFVATPLDTLIALSSAILQIDLGRFADDAGNRRDSIARIPIAVTPIRQVGTLQGSIRDTAVAGASYVVVAQMNGNGLTYRRSGLKSGSSWEFVAIPEGEYTIFAFRDSDGDGSYDYGSLSPYSPAEAYTGWRGTVRVRPRWVTNKIDLVFSR